MFTAIRTAARQFRHHPGFALVTVLLLGIGTAAATTVFTVVDTVVLRPLPYREPANLVTLWDTNYKTGVAHDPISPVNFMDYRALPVFKDAAAWWRPSMNLIDAGLEPVRVKAIEASGNFFAVLGVRPQVGAGFPAAGSYFVPNQPSAVISDRLWRTRYSGDPARAHQRRRLPRSSKSWAWYTTSGMPRSDRNPSRPSTSAPGSSRSASCF